MGSVSEIDEAMKAGAGHPMGPLTLADFVGLDTMGAICGVMYQEFAERRFAQPPTLRKMLAAGWYGKKSGMGFYDYAGDAPVENPGHRLARSGRHQLHAVPAGRLHEGARGAPVLGARVGLVAGGAQRLQRVLVARPRPPRRAPAVAPPGRRRTAGGSGSRLAAATRRARAGEGGGSTGSKPRIVQNASAASRSAGSSSIATCWSTGRSGVGVVFGQEGLLALEVGADLRVQTLDQLRAEAGGALQRLRRRGCRSRRSSDGGGGRSRRRCGRRS